MGIKIKFLTPIKLEKFLHNLVNAKKRNSNYKHYSHELIDNDNNEFTFRIFDDSRDIVYCDISCYTDGTLHIEVKPGCDLDALQSLLVFDLLEDINEKAVIRFLTSKYFFNGDKEFYYVADGPRTKLQKVSSNRDDLLEVDNSRTIAQITQILEEIQQVDFI